MGPVKVLPPTLREKRSKREVAAAPEAKRKKSRFLRFSLVDAEAAVDQETAMAKDLLATVRALEAVAVVAAAAAKDLLPMLMIPIKLTKLRQFNSRDAKAEEVVKRAKDRVHQKVRKDPAVAEVAAAVDLLLRVLMRKLSPRFSSGAYTLADLPKKPKNEEVFRVSELSRKILQ